ncbi:dimethylarginine dimethylaminohydrolase family protein [Fodinicurvata sediminis]|uniref:dimethylarginine dimethylaminohydrolase family protein n=1 Tax=Fodinicurvata sediminis TaxID=1121832 RepID=UPI00047C29FD|nr:arginine deiminase-related protein [Fodinicurvata sediminis]
MRPVPTFLMTDPTHYEVSYAINPWMKPELWSAAAAERHGQAVRCWSALRKALEQAGAKVEVVPGQTGLPDMLFPANAAVVLDGRALLARFLHPERQGEEPHFQAHFEQLRDQGRLREVALLPEGIFHEGAGDCIWDPLRRHFWVGWGQRSSYESAAALEAHFGFPVVPLELVSPRYYHLDVCFYPLPGGEVVFHPGALSDASVAEIRRRVPADLRIEATREEADLLCLNAVNLGRDIIMAKGTARLKGELEARGYRCTELDLDPFILSGGAAYCMTLRLDRSSVHAAPDAAPPVHSLSEA